MKLTKEDKEFYETKKQAFLDIAAHAKQIKEEVRLHFDKVYIGKKVKVSKKASKSSVAGKEVHVHGVHDVFTIHGVELSVSTFKAGGEELSSKVVKLPVEDVIGGAE